MSETDSEREQRQRRHTAAHEDAAAVHDRAAKMHRDAADFFDVHDEPGKAQLERDLADRETRLAGAERDASEQSEEPGRPENET